jgi:hypothetical protein
MMALLASVIPEKQSLLMLLCPCPLDLQMHFAKNYLVELGYIDDRIKVKG